MKSEQLHIPSLEPTASEKLSQANIELSEASVQVSEASIRYNAAILGRITTRNMVIFYE